MFSPVTNRTVLCGLTFAFFVLISVQLVQCQTLRICSYNMLDNPTSTIDDQNMRAVIDAVGDFSVLGNSQAIDILAFQEGPADASQYSDIEANFETVFGGNYSSSITPPDFAGCRTGFIYNTDTVQLLAAISLTGSFTHNSRRGLFRPVGGTSEDDFYLYSIHLKAGSIDPEDAETRGFEATAFRTNANNTLPGDAQIIYCGDFNMTGSDEQAYANFFAPGTNSAAMETLNSPFGYRDGVSWRDNNAFIPFHTQDPGASMDDRFDAFFINGAMIDGTGFEYIKGSCSVLGNNGTHTLNANVTTGSGAAGFATQLLAFSDHLPVFCDFAWGRKLKKLGSSLNVDASITRYVRQTGPVGGTAGSDDLQIEGSSNSVFAAFAIFDFDMTGQISPGTFVGDTDNIALNMIQDNANFTDGGAIDVYVTTAAASQIPITSSIQYQSGQNGIDCVPAALADGATMLSRFASIHEANGAILPDGTTDNIALYGTEIGSAITNALATDGTLRLLIVPTRADTVATFAGFTSVLGTPSISADLFLDDGSTDVMATSFSVTNGTQGSGNLVNINESDDERIGFFAGPIASKNDAPIQLLMTGDFSGLNPQTLNATVESSANTPNLTIGIEFFNFDTAEWEEIGVEAEQLGEVQHEYSASGDVSRFVGAGNAVLTRISWRADGPVLSFPWGINIDQFKWSITQQ